MTSILDCSDNNPAPSVATFRRYDAVIGKLYGAHGNVGWTADFIRTAKAAGRRWGLYSADQTLTWGSTVEALKAQGLKPGEVPLYQDWFEWFIQDGVNADDATALCEQGLILAHRDNVKLGGYGAELNAWTYFDRAGLRFDSRWVAHVGETPRIPYDLHQYGKGFTGDTNTTHLTVAALFDQTLGPWREPEPMGSADVYFDHLSHEGITTGDFLGNQSYLVGYRIGKRGIAFPDRLKGNPDAEQGFKDAGGKLA